MRKNFYYPILIGFLFLSQALLAQIPPTYYDTADGLDGAALKSSLHNIIDDHTSFPYTSSGTDVWDILKVSNQNPVYSDSVVLIYSGVSSDGALEYDSGNGWNREHIWAKSRGDFGTATGVGTDVHNITPADISVNSARNNRWFEECAIPYYDNGAFTGSYTCGSSLWAWEPRDEVKGDVARILFYMDTRYEGDASEPDLSLIDSIPSDNGTKEPIHARLSTLIEWHLNDPVDAFETNRNNVIYSYQGNRNPFIDHPDFVCQIWPLECSVLPLDLISFNLDYQKDGTQVALYWRTENQVNSSHFIIERSRNAKNWEALAELEAKEGIDRINYQFLDTKAKAGNNYYRLKMIDFDNSFEYSNIQVARIDQTLTADLQIYPNPNNGNCTISFPSEAGLKTQIRVYDNLGKVLQEETIISEEHSSTYALNISSLPSGVYSVQVQDKFQTRIARLVKQ